MRFQYFFFFLIEYSLVVFSSGQKYQYKIENFDVRLDHFTFTTDQTFKLRYLINDTYFNEDDPNSPIFFCTGNEIDIQQIAQNAGFIWETAPEFNALIVFAEYRYYGESLPFGNLSFSSPEFSGYMTTGQALADWAQLLVELINPNQRPVIAFGASLGANLAAWFRMKYPHLVTGAIAASGPMTIFESDCDALSKGVSNPFNSFDPQCSQNIRQSWDVIKKNIATPEGRQILNSKLQFCEPLTQPDDYSKFAEYVAYLYLSIGAFNYPYSAYPFQKLPANPVKEFCSRLNSSYDDEQLLSALREAISIYSNFTGTSDCLDLNYNSNLNKLGRAYQLCTEMVVPVCSKDDKNSIFPQIDWNFDQYSDMCYQKFKVRPVKSMPTMYYSTKMLKYASNILFSNGLIDPWSVFGILDSSNSDLTIVVMPDTAHHLEYEAANINDPKSVEKARKKERKAIRKWLKHYNDD